MMCVGEDGRAGHPAQNTHIQREGKRAAMPVLMHRGRWVIGGCEGARRHWNVCVKVDENVCCVCVRACVCVCVCVCLCVVADLGRATDEKIDGVNNSRENNQLSCRCHPSREHGLASANHTASTQAEIRNSLTRRRQVIF
jgi:hypothetical protein